MQVEYTSALYAGGPGRWVYSPGRGRQEVLVGVTQLALAVPFGFVNGNGGEHPPGHPSAAPAHGPTRPRGGASYVVVAQHGRPRQAG